MTDEQYVRANWESVPAAQLAGFKVLPTMSKVSMIAELAAFTRERKEEIREREEEIELLNLWTYDDSELLETHDWQDIRSHVRICRAITRLDAELETLRRGMK